MDNLQDGEKVLVDRKFLLDLAESFEDSHRFGYEADEPEGIRYMRISDTLAKELSKLLRRYANA